MTSAQISQVYSLFRRRINNNKSIHSNLLTLLHDLFFAVNQERIVVTKEDDWNFEAAGTGFANVVKTDGDVGSVQQCTL